MNLDMDSNVVIDIDDDNAADKNSCLIIYVRRSFTEIIVMD